MGILWPRLAYSSFAIVLLAVFAPKSFAAEPSGTTVAVVPSAAASGETGQRILEVMGPVFMGDRVQTGASGEAQIKFRDNTKLVVGKNSLLTIDAFVFNENDTARQVTMNAVKGAFRFISGNSQKQAYKINTPTTTIGIRGTRFDLAIESNGQTTFALFEGEARLCERGGRCKILSGRCAVAVVPPRGEISDLPAGPERAARLAALFPYVVSQSRLHPEFRVDTSSCAIRHARLNTDQELRALAPVVPGLTPPGPIDPTDPSRAGNPGNNEPVGNAGENPNGRSDWGGGTGGRSDSGTSSSGGNSAQSSNSNVGGSSGGNGKGKGPKS